MDLTTIRLYGRLRLDASKKRKEPKEKNDLSLSIRSIVDRIDLSKMQNEDPKTECRETQTTDASATLAMPENENPESSLSPYCDARKCKICASGYVDEVNALRGKKTLREMSAYMKEEFDLDIGKDVFAHHFQRYTEKLRAVSLPKAYAAFHAETETVAKHQTQVLFLASHTFNEIIRRLQNGTLDVGNDQFEKLLKLYYQILRDPDAAALPDVTEIYIRAAKRYNVPLSNTSLPLEFRDAEPNEPDLVSRAMGPGPG